MSNSVSSMIGVTAYGVPDSNGYFPTFSLIVDGNQIGQAAATGTLTTFLFNDVVSSDAPHTVQIGFYDTNGARAVELTSITVNGQTYAATSSSESYSSRVGVVQGSGDMQYGGTATFAIPAGASSSASDPMPTTKPGPVTPTTPTTVTIGSGSDTLSLAVSEDAYLGDAQFTISIDGAQQGGVQTSTASNSAGQTQRFDILGSFGAGTHTVSVNFLNDAYGGTATTDRNLYIQSASLNGQVIAGSTLAETSAGPQSFSFGKAAAAPVATTTPVPAAPVTPSSPATVMIGSGPDTLSLAVAEDAYSGDAQFTISIDGTQQGGVQTTTASNSAGQTQLFDILGSFGAGAHTVSVNFLNDAYGGTAATDRNLYVLSASIDGQAIAGSALSETSAGPQSFSFGKAAPPAATPTPVSTTPVTPSSPATVTIGSGSDTLALVVAEDAYLGDAQFTISIDGIQQGGVQTTTASSSAGQTQMFDILGSFGTSAHTVSVNFLNDAYGGTAATDRNLYVQSASIDGKAIAGSTLNETSAGPQSFSFGSTPVATATPVPVPTPASTAIHVSASGSDGTGDGSAAHPFATLQHAISIAEQSSTKMIDIADGTYHIGSTLTLTTADNGISISGSAGATLDGSGAGTILDLQQTKNVSISGLKLQNASTSAVIIDGGAQNTISGATFVNNVEDVLLQNGASNNTVSGNTMLSTGTSAIEVKDGSDRNIFSNNLINGVGASETSGGGFYLHGADNNLITHNLIENTQGAGINLADFYQTGTETENIGNTISYNDLENTDLSSTDSGAIYILGRSQADTMTTVSMNFINGAGRADQHSVGIYLDDNTNGVTVSDNIVTGSMSDAFQIHGGNDDQFVNNLFDLGTGAASAGLFQPSPDDQYSATQFQNDLVMRNVYVSESSSPKSPLFVNLGSGRPTVSRNDYWSNVGAHLNAAPDTAPAYVNPNVSAGNYTTSGDGIGFIAIDRSMIGLLHS